MTTAIQARNGAALTLWNNADVALVKSMVADKATDDEFRLLIHLANKYQLDPLAKQIYCIKYGNKPASMFAGLAGFITIAERSGQYGGVLPEVWRDEELLDVKYWDNGREAHYTRDYQWVAKATVYRRDAPHPFVAQVWESEYSSGQNLWVSKPRTMLQKVAMCQALRLAFSISGLYDQDEIKEAPPAPVTVNPATGEIIDGTARELPLGRAESHAETRPPADVPSDTLPTGIVINPGKALDIVAAGRAYRTAAETAGFATTEAQNQFAKEQYPGRGLSTLTADEWRALELRCRAMYSDVPAPDEAPIF